METEKDKMLAGKPYKAFGDELLAERQHAKALIFELNSLHPNEIEKRNEIVRRLLGQTGKSFFIEPPFRCDYGYNISIGESFYANYNCTILDCAKVTIGNNVLFAPNVSIFTAGHPIHHEPRNQEFEYAFPIQIGNNVWIGGNVVVNPGVTIGNNVWIGGNVVINPGVSIGNNTVIGSGSVVTKDIPSDVIAVGNPCKVLRKITEEDKSFYYKNLLFE